MKQFKAKSENALHTPERHNFNAFPPQRSIKDLAPLEISEEQGNTAQNIFQKLALQFRRAIIHKDPIIAFRAIKAIELKLTEDDKSSLEDFLETGLISDIVRLLDSEDKINTELQYEILWIIVYSCRRGEERTSKIVTRRLAETILRFIWHPELKIVEAAFFVFGNISWGSDAETNLLLKLSALSKFTKKTKKCFPQEILRPQSFIMNKISRNYESHAQIFKYNLLGLLQNMLWQDDHEICVNACWTYSRLIERGDEKCIAALVIPKFIDRIVQLLESTNQGILWSAVRIVRSILSSGSCYKTQIYSTGCLDKLEVLIDHIKPVIRSEAIQAISNLVTEPNLIAEIFERPLFAKLIKTIIHDFIPVKQEAIVCFANVLSIADQKQVESLIKFGFLKVFPTVFRSSNFDVVMAGLTALEGILRHGFGLDYPANPYIRALEKEGTTRLIEGLQFHPDHNVSRAVVRIIETYFETEEELFL